MLHGALTAHPHVVRGPLEDLCNGPERLPRAGLHHEPDDLVVIVVTIIQRAG